MIMRFRDFLEIRRAFASQVDIRLMLDEKERAQEEARYEMLLMFESGQQHTWLAASKSALFCVFDIINEEGPRVLWSLPCKELVMNNNRVSVGIKTEEHSARTGYVTINGMKRRKYTKALFQRTPIDT